MNFENSQYYDNPFYEMHIDWKPEYKLMANWILENCQFEKYLEMGCGNAFLSEFIHQSGKDIKCIDFSPDCARYIDTTIKDKFERIDLTEAIDVKNYQSDLVTCFEIAEHITPQGTETFLENVTSASTKILLFSSEETDINAPHIHCNCKSRNEWIRLITEKGFTFNDQLTQKFQNDLKPHIHKIDWFIKNFLYFERKEQ